MKAFYQIANLIVEMDSFGRSVYQAEPYKCAETLPDVTICVDSQKLKQEQPHLSDEDCEYICTGASFYRQLLAFDGMMLHASAVVMDGYAYLFSAPSGTGKSTHTRLWLEVFGDRAYILNDDKPALRLEDGIWYVYGTPWSGKQDLSVNARIPLGGICMLHREKENWIEPFEGVRAIHALLEQTLRPADPGLRMRLMELLDRLMTMVPIWQMGCNMDPAAAMISFEAMSQRKKGVGK